MSSPMRAIHIVIICANMDKRFTQQFVRLSDLQFVRPMQNASFVRPIHIGRTNGRSDKWQVGQMAGRTNGRSDKWRILCIGRTNVAVGQTSGRTNVGRTNVDRANMDKRFLQHHKMDFKSNEKIIHDFFIHLIHVFNSFMFHSVLSFLFHVPFSFIISFSSHSPNLFLIHFIHLI